MHITPSRKAVVKDFLTTVAKFAIVQSRGDAGRSFFLQKWTKRQKKALCIFCKLQIIDRLQELDEGSACSIYLKEKICLVRDIIPLNKKTDPV